jgi:formiminotetrahydrofolate cyclodeaminase
VLVLVRQDGGMAEPDLLDLTLADFLTRVAAPTPAPGAGAVAGAVVALAAGLAAMSAGLSRRQLADADELAARALELQERARPLGLIDGEAYAGVLSAQRLPKDDPGRSDALRAALSAATDVPLEIATIGAAVHDIAADVVRRGNPNLEGDARTACLMAQSAVRSAAVLIELNLAADPDDPRLRQVAQLVEAVRQVPARPVG